MILFINSLILWAPSIISSVLLAYENLMVELLKYFSKKIKRLNKFEINDVILDPGFGFAKDYNQNYEILKNSVFF